MFRTRDFILYFTIVVFLLTAIGFTVFEKNTDTSTSTNIATVETEITTVSATVVSSSKNTLSREDRLAALKQKIKNSELTNISEPEPDTIDLVIEDVAPSVLTESVPQFCSTYEPNLIVNWPLGEIKTTFAEGARQYFTEHSMKIGTSSSTTIEKNTLLTLSSHFVPLGPASCLSSDVIGIALDGSLIRNNEIGLYSIFSDETLIGYALDGYPIYGLGEQEVDSCGGRIELGQYRYELAAERTLILNCFAGVPETFIR